MAALAVLDLRPKANQSEEVAGDGVELLPQEILHRYIKHLRDPLQCYGKCC